MQIKTNKGKSKIADGEKRLTKLFNTHTNTWILNIAPVVYGQRDEKEGLNWFQLLYKVVRKAWADTDVTKCLFSLNGSEGEAKTSGKHSSFTAILTLGTNSTRAPWHTHTHIIQCRKTFTGNALEDLDISIFHLDYIQEKKAALSEKI